MKHLLLQPFFDLCSDPALHFTRQDHAGLSLPFIHQPFHFGGFVFSCLVEQVQRKLFPFRRADPLRESLVFLAPSLLGYCAPDPVRHTLDLCSHREQIGGRDVGLHVFAIASAGPTLPEVAKLPGDSPGDPEEVAGCGRAGHVHLIPGLLLRPPAANGIDDPRGLWLARAFPARGIICPAGAPVGPGIRLSARDQERDVPHGAPVFAFQEDLDGLFPGRPFRFLVEQEDQYVQLLRDDRRAHEVLVVVGGVEDQVEHVRQVDVEGRCRRGDTGEAVVVLQRQSEDVPLNVLCSAVARIERALDTVARVVAHLVANPGVGAETVALLLLVRRRPARSRALRLLGRTRRVRVDERRGVRLVGELPRRVPGAVHQPAVALIPVAHACVAGSIAVLVRKPGLWASGGALGNVPREVHLLSLHQRVEVGGPDLIPQHNIVVEVDELVCEPGNAVKVTLDRGGAENWKVRRIDEYGLVRHDLDLWMVNVQPVWDLIIRDNVYSANPRCEPPEGPQRISKFLVVSVSIGIPLAIVRRHVPLHVLQRRYTKPFFVVFEFCLEPWIRSVDPSVDHVDHRSTELFFETSPDYIVAESCGTGSLYEMARRRKATRLGVLI
mmetsp:Transcript_10120/g.24917  ORF Transcript_10120/g.24917 Transcript_10120/m.24917 type:complete len:609 (+) Transcript_10120:1137-2963(+)